MCGSVKVHRVISERAYKSNELKTTFLIYYIYVTTHKVRHRINQVKSNIYYCSVICCGNDENFEPIKLQQDIFLYFSPRFDEKY